MYLDQAVPSQTHVQMQPHSVVPAGMDCGEEAEFAVDMANDSTMNNRNQDATSTGMLHSMFRVVNDAGESLRTRRRETWRLTSVERLSPR